MIRLEIVEDTEPDPEIEKWLDHLVALSKIADTCHYYIGPARQNPCSEGLDNEPAPC